MNLQRKHWIIGAVAITALVAAIVWSSNYVDDRRSDAVASIAEADACEQLARDVAHLRQRRAGVTSEPARQVELNRRIAQAAADAGLPARALERIEHDPPRRAAAAGGPIERPTRIAIRQATLRQFAAMLQSLDRPGDGVRVTRVHLASPEDPTDAGTWNAEATLTETCSAPANESIRPSNPQ